MIPLAISAASSLIGGAMNFFGKKKTNDQQLQIAREQNKANQQLQDSQNQWNLEQWNRENAYNNASAQKQRLLDAGINPAFAMGQIASGSATSSQLQSAPYTPAVAPEYTSPWEGSGNVVGDFMSTYMNMRMNEANVKAAEARAKRETAEADAVSGYRATESQSNIEKNRVMSQMAVIETKQKQLDLTINKEFQRSTAAKQLLKLTQDVLESKSRVINNEKTARKIVSDTVVNYARAQNLKLENTRLRATTDLLIDKMKLDNQSIQYLNQMRAPEARAAEKYGFGAYQAGYQQLQEEARRSHWERRLSEKKVQWWNVNQTLENASKLGSAAGSLYQGFGLGSLRGMVTRKAAEKATKNSWSKGLGF